MTEKLQLLWEQCREINNENLNTTRFNKSPKPDPNEYRLDDLGAVIKKSEYGKKTEFGWTIDHIFPVSLGGDDNIRNLQLLHWSNKERKGDDFPDFKWDTTFNNDGDGIGNIKMGLQIFHKASYIETLFDLYPVILRYRKNPLNAIDL